MKANEFVKRAGWNRAKQFVNADDIVHALVFATTAVSFIDVKRLVKSHDLVQNFVDLEICKHVVAIAPSDATHVKINLGTPIFYIESSNDADQSGLWIDDEDNGYWGLSSYQNYELSIVENKFIVLDILKQAIADMESCQ